ALRRSNPLPYTTLFRSAQAPGRRPPAPARAGARRRGRAAGARSRGPERWRPAGRCRPGRRARWLSAPAHSANALAFLVGIVQQAATVPVRAIALRRLAPDASPPLELVLVADAPVLAQIGRASCREED